MKRSTALLLVAAIFVAGIGVGVVATHLYYLERFSRPGSIADAAVAVAGRRITRQLALRPDQERELERILVDTRSELEDVRRDTARDVREVRDRAAGRLRAVLDDAQRAELERLRREEGKIFDAYLE